jgi:hypothetical protein
MNEKTTAMIEKLREEFTPDEIHAAGHRITETALRLRNFPLGSLGGIQLNEREATLTAGLMLLAEAVINHDQGTAG